MFYHKGPIPSFTKACFPAASELCKDAPRTHRTIPWEKMSGETVPWELISIPVVILTGWNNTVRWLPCLKSEGACCFHKTPKLYQSYCFNEKNETVCFSGSFEVETIQLSQWENTSFAIRPQFPGSQNHVSLKFQNCVKTLLGHTVPFHEKTGRGKCWVLTAIPAVTLIQWSSSHGASQQDVASSPFLFRKIKNSTKAVAMKGKMNQWVFLEGWGHIFPAS